MAEQDPVKLREQATRQLRALEGMRDHAARQHALAGEFDAWAATIEQRARVALARVGVAVADGPLDVEAARQLLGALGG